MVAQRPRQAGRLVPMGDPDAHTLPMPLRICEASYRESIEASGVDLPSSLQRATSVALTKAAYFRISLVLRITTYARP
jgi:hypothetical protein